MPIAGGAAGVSAGCWRTPTRVAHVHTTERRRSGTPDGGPIEVTYGVLGPLLVTNGERTISLTAGKQRALLTALLIDAGKVVSVEELLRRMWGDTPPGGARNTLQNHVLRLRRILQGAGGASPIVTCPEGYLVAPSVEALDLGQFHTLVARAKAALASGDPETALTDLRCALDLWRGDPLCDVPSDAMHREVVPVLVEQRLAAVALRIDVELQLGRHEEAVVELHDLTTRYPLRERFWAQRMVALYQSGRTADALECYGVVSRVLRNELGMDPGPELCRIHRAVLTNDPEVIPRSVASASYLTRQAPRCDLPADVADFTGRTAEVTRVLDSMLTRVDRPAQPSVAVTTIDGMPGVGKTALAIHAAYRLADHFPDGQLFVDLHGHAAKREPADPADVLNTLLRAIGVPAVTLPATLEERASLWRAQLANRRVLLLLDDAASAAQVRPLLPGAPGSVVLVTSRNRLADLDATAIVSLRTLAPEDAQALFADIVGDQALGRADAVAEAVRLCGYLPLAIRIAAARLRSRSSWTVEQMAGRLGDPRTRLAELAAGDRSVAQAFATSCDRLNPVQRRLLGVLSRTFRGRFDPHAAAAAFGVPVHTMERALEELVDTNLVEQAGADRYLLHDLVRCHAQPMATAFGTRVRAAAGAGHEGSVALSVAQVGHA
jgi:DNA-binding SARP family transcriptional activator